MVSISQKKTTIRAAIDRTKCANIGNNPGNCRKANHRVLNQKSMFLSYCSDRDYTRYLVKKLRTETREIWNSVLLECMPRNTIQINLVKSLFTLETHARSLKKWACIFPIFHAVVLLGSSKKFPHTIRRKSLILVTDKPFVL